MSPQPPPSDSPSTLVVAGLAVLGAVWAAMRWLLWPRVQATIRGEVDAACKTLRDELREHVRTKDAGIAHIVVTIEGLSERMRVQGERISATGAAVDVLLERRVGPAGRREHDA